MAKGNEFIAYFIPGSSRPVQRGQPYMVFSIYSGTWQTHKNTSIIFFRGHKDAGEKSNTAAAAGVMTKDKVRTTFH